MSDKHQQIADLMALIFQEHFLDPNNLPTSGQLKETLMGYEKFNQLTQGLKIVELQDQIGLEIVEQY